MLVALISVVLLEYGNIGDEGIISIDLLCLRMRDVRLSDLIQCGLRQLDDLSLFIIVPGVPVHHLFSFFFVRFSDEVMSPLVRMLICCDKELTFLKHFFL